MIISEKKQSICSSAEAESVFRAMLGTEDAIGQEREHFWALGLNTKNVTQYAELVSLGTMTTSLVHPRELFRLAILKGAVGLILGHNHPSNDAKPSQEDILLTKRLVQAGVILGIQILDHVIIGQESGFFSFRDNGLISASA